MGVNLSDNVLPVLAVLLGEGYLLDGHLGIGGIVHGLVHSAKVAVAYVGLHVVHGADKGIALLSISCLHSTRSTSTPIKPLLTRTQRGSSSTTDGDMYWTHQPGEEVLWVARGQ